MPVSAVFDNLEAGATIDEIIEQFDLTREQINAVLEFAARSLDAPVPAGSPVNAHSLSLSRNLSRRRSRGNGDDET